MLICVRESGAWRPYLLLQTVNIFNGHMTHNDRVRGKNVVVEKGTSLFAGFDVTLILLLQHPPTSVLLFFPVAFF